MTYEESVSYLLDIPRFSRKTSLENLKELLKILGDPQEQVKAVHIAGTNGKGSCSHTLAAILQNDGYKVGLYTSPHIMDFRERIKINGECISKEYVIEFVNQEKSLSLIHI